MVPATGDEEDTMTAAIAPFPEERRIPMTYDEWLEWAEGPRMSEWVDGEAIEFMPPTERHQDVVLFLAMLLRALVELRGLGSVIAAPFEVRIRSRGSREPDVIFVAQHRRHLLDGKRLNGAPDLAIEVISDDSVRRDRITKRDEYAAARVPEYWIVDCRPGHEREEFLLLDEGGRYREADLDERGRFHSAVLPGFWLDPAWLRADPMPSAFACLKEIAPDAFA